MYAKSENVPSKTGVIGDKWNVTALKNENHCTSKKIQKNKKKYAKQLRSNIKKIHDTIVVQETILEINSKHRTHVKFDIIPFKHCVLSNFLTSSSIIEKLADEMKYITWNRKQMDLYKFNQSHDLNNIELPHLKQFYKFLCTGVWSWMTAVTGMHFTSVSTTCSMFNETDFLLPHDDMMSDRLVAFIFYLSPYVKTWNENMGGQLSLFGVKNCDERMYITKSVKEINPCNNQFIFFPVGATTYHEVTEVLTSEVPRLTINGWFHGPPPKLPDIAMNRFITEQYLNEDNITDMQECIRNTKSLSLHNYLKEEVYDSLLKDIKSMSVRWSRTGPISKCLYDIASLDSFNKDTTIFLNAFSSCQFLKLFGIDVDSKLSANRVFQCRYEIQRWTHRNYLVLHDFNKSATGADHYEIIIFLGCVDRSSAGTVQFIRPDKPDEIPLIVPPENNSCNLVHLDQEGFAKIVKYINCKASVDGYVYMISGRYYFDSPE